MTRVLVVATSRKTRGGITSVVKAHEQGEQWKQFHCHWVQTHRDGNTMRKMWSVVIALIEYFYLLPFYDIVHIHIATPISAKRKQLFFYPAKWLGKKTIFHFHPSNEKFLFEPRNQKLYRSLFSKADMVLVLSKQWQKWIKESLGLEDGIKVLYNPCQHVNRREDLYKCHILFAGTIIPRKGYETLLRGFALIAAKYPDWKIIFAGNGEIDKAREIMTELGIEDQVEFKGWIVGTEKEKVFQEASIYCLASDGEGFPMAVLDAWAYGIPCVVTPVGGLSDIVKDGENALVFPVCDIEKLSNQLDRLMGDKELRKKIATASIELADSIFNVETINQKLGQIYAGIVDKCDEKQSGITI
jgi:glycosyltransferase involved in cell wall biosynthesis